MSLATKNSRTIVYLLRHAAFENPDNVIHLRLPGFPLSEMGREQARRLSQTLVDVPIAAVYSSPLTRAYQTAEIIAQPHGLRVTTDERLLDLRSPLQGKPLSYMESISFNFYRHECIRAGGERLSEVFRRMDTFLKEVVRKHHGQELVVVSHGDIIMSIVTKYRGGHLYTRRVFLDDYVRTGEGYRLAFNEHAVCMSIEKVGY